ncbi:hypothetical protein LPJ70_004882 [Coemansia sp. RSA 2708]|nr:hypothetical protein LPJ70_004882 [Coemansia sp. RSA 2708]KAJ2369331.1 hypothetical protein H4S01_001068 [Coemansia sp. RSA 2610]
MSVVTPNLFDLLQDNATTADVDASKKPQAKKKPQQPATGTRSEREQPKPIRSEYPRRGGHRAPAAREAARAGEPVVEQDRRARGPHATRGGRGGAAPRGRGRQFDRHSATGLVDSAKKEKQGWLGAPEDLPADEAAAAVAAAKDAQSGAATPQEEAEPEEVVKSLDDYLSERAQTSLETKHAVRAANEGVDASLLKQGVQLDRTEEEFFPATVARKTRRNKERKEKPVVYDIEQRFPDQGRRPAFRNGRADRPAGARQQRVNLNDQSAFPSL